MCLNSIATEKSGNAELTIQLWLSDKNELELLTLWEEKNNPQFREEESDELTGDAGLSTFTFCLEEWIQYANAISLFVDKRQVYAHPEIALAFSYWMCPREKLKAVEVLNERSKREFQRGKRNLQIIK